ncbi:hypothetical protein [Chryseobacterium oranimense]|uniref:hypothetical protein n=1 Tax=Chryseobacterium oranimense TaxID=421058 RepID=UPI002235F32F|nr:hypothetical protein [Chryseobacterium oranimense]
MSTIKPIKKSQTKFNKEILTISHQEYQSNSIFKDTSEIQVIAAFYLILKMFRKIKVNFDVNFRISGRKKVKK